MEPSATASVMLSRRGRRAAPMPGRASSILLFFLGVFAPLALVSPSRATAADAGMKPAAPPSAPAAVAPVAASAKAAAKTPKSAATTSKSAKKPRAPKNPPVVLYTVNHKETLSLRLRDAQGKPI